MSIILVLSISKYFKIRYNIQNIAIMTVFLSIFQIVFSKFNIDDHSMKSPIAKMVHDNSVIIHCFVFFILSK